MRLALIRKNSYKKYNFLWKKNKDFCLLTPLFPLHFIPLDPDPHHCSRQILARFKVLWRILIMQIRTWCPKKWELSETLGFQPVDLASLASPPPSSSSRRGGPPNSCGIWHSPSLKSRSFRCWSTGLHTNVTLTHEAPLY